MQAAVKLFWVLALSAIAVSLFGVIAGEMAADEDPSGVSRELMLFRAKYGK